MGKIIDSSILIFIFVIILSSLDFWTVKNVTGRLLVGLRWWSEVDKDGKEIWRFENPDETIKANIVDKTFFWTSQIAGTAGWGLFFVVNIFSFSIFWVPMILFSVFYSSFACLSAEQISMLTTNAEEIIKAS